MKDFDEAKKLLESTGHLLVEKREKKTFDTFMTYLMDQNGRCSADGGDHTFYCLKLNDENFDFNGYDKFKEQIGSQLTGTFPLCLSSSFDGIMSANQDES